VFRNGQWHVLKSFNNAYVVIGWGLPGDKPMPGDYNSNGFDDYAVFRPSNGVWYVRDGHIAATFSQQFGLNGDKPAPRDYDGDGKFDLAVYRPSTGVWYVFNSYTQTVSIVNWGISEDIPMPSEYLGGDGKADIAGMAAEQRNLVCPRVEWNCQDPTVRTQRRYSASTRLWHSRRSD
jgi:hypothetical protein